MNEQLSKDSLLSGRKHFLMHMVLLVVISKYLTQKKRIKEGKEPIKCRVSHVCEGIYQNMRQQVI